MDVLSLLQTLGGIVGGLGVGYFTKSGRVKSQADAYKAMAEAYEYRIAALHESIAKCNDMEKSHTGRIAELNVALNGKTDQIRKLTDEIIASERKANEINDQLSEAKDTIIAKEREIADLRVAVEYLLEWRCEKAECTDEGGRRPPNGKLKGQSFQMPQIVALIREAK